MSYHSINPKKGILQILENTIKYIINVTQLETNVYLHKNIDTFYEFLLH